MIVDTAHRLGTTVQDLRDLIVRHQRILPKQTLRLSSYARLKHGRLKNWSGATSYWQQMMCWKRPACRRSAGTPIIEICMHTL
jgi:hypothetical protein